MKKALSVIAVIAAGAACVAEPVSQPIYIATGAGTAGTQTVASVRMEVDAITVSVSDGTSTGAVVVSYSPLDTALASVNLATNSVTDEKTWRPRVDGTDVSGAALTSDAPGRYLLTGDTVSFVVTGSPTGVTWRCTLNGAR